MWYKIFIKGYTLLCNGAVSVKNRIHAGQLTQKGQKLFKNECRKMSEMLADDFISISTPENNFYKMYIYSDARFWGFRRVRQTVAKGKKNGLLSAFDGVKAYLICGYGYIRPMIRKVYYAIFRRIKTS